LRRSRVGWEELDVPRAIRDMAEEVWEQLQTLAEPGADAVAAQRRLDASRSSYDDVYAEAESIAHSSVTASKPRRAKPPPPPPPSNLRARLPRRIPKRYRTGLRSLAASLRRAH
jgi:hypothetical protein